MEVAVAVALTAQAQERWTAIVKHPIQYFSYVLRLYAKMKHFTDVSIGECDGTI